MSALAPFGWVVRCGLALLKHLHHPLSVHLPQLAARHRLGRDRLDAHIVETRRAQINLAADLQASQLAQRHANRLKADAQGGGQVDGGLRQG